MEELSAAGQVATEEIGWLKEDLSREVSARLSPEEAVVQLKGELEKKGSEVLKRDSELQQRESALLEARQDLEGMRLRAEEAGVALRSDQDAFEKVRECLIVDLNRVQIALEEAEAREQEAVTDCQHALKVIKFKKYKKRVRRWEAWCVPKVVA